MFKKLVITTAILTASFINAAQAKLIDLNNQNGSMCRQQLLDATNRHMPIVMIYMKGCPWADKVMPFYKQVADENPDHNFYFFEFTRGDIYAIAKTAHDCLGFFPFFSPSFVMLNTNFGTVQGVQKQDLDGTATIDDIRKFVGVASESNPAYTIIK